MHERTLTGKVSRAWVHIGSKSEREAVVIETSDGQQYVLRRQGGPAFDDPALDELVGLSLEVEGLESGNTIIMRRWQDAEDCE
jgi:hypothetical protein